MSRRVITTTGPLELSGFAAGVSVEGPIASVSVRLSSAGGPGFDASGSGIDSPGVSLVSDGCAPVVSVGNDVGAGSEVCAAFADWSGAEAGNVFISTGLDDNAACPLLGREPDCWGALCAGVAWAGWSEGDDEAIAPRMAP